jgi:hypothetical protein
MSLRPSNAYKEDKGIWRSLKALRIQGTMAMPSMAVLLSECIFRKALLITEGNLLWAFDSALKHLSLISEHKESRLDDHLHSVLSGFA